MLYFAKTYALCEAKKKECTLPFLFRENVCPTGVKESSGSSTSHRQKYLGNTKNKKQGFALPTFQVALVFFLSAIF